MKLLVKSVFIFAGFLLLSYVFVGAFGPIIEITPRSECEEFSVDPDPATGTISFSHGNSVYVIDLQPLVSGPDSSRGGTP